MSLGIVGGFMRCVSIRIGAQGSGVQMSLVPMVQACRRAEKDLDMDTTTTLADDLAGANSTVPAQVSAGSRRRFLLVDDHEVVRYSVKSLYTELQGVSLEWLEANSLQEALAIYARESHFDAVLLDLNLADCKGLQGLCRFIGAHPAARIAVFSATHDEFVVRQARALGAVAYIPKGVARCEMREALSALLWPQGGPQSQGFAPGNALFPRFPSSAMHDRVAKLGPQHIDLLSASQPLSGLSNQEISNTMQLALCTVNSYVSSLLLALDVKSRSHMVSLFR
ncbi:MAG: response regulator transcription factor [Burkholderiales bacterium]|nr:response regulator transcription factor [Burkholderiales bacterium]